MTLYKMDKGEIVEEEVLVVERWEKRPDGSVDYSVAFPDLPKAIMPSFEERAAKAKEICRTLPETVTQIHATEQATRLYDEWLMSRIKPIEFPSDEEIASKMKEMGPDGWDSVTFYETVAWLKERLK